MLNPNLYPKEVEVGSQFVDFNNRSIEHKNDTILNKSQSDRSNKDHLINERNILDDFGK